MKPEPFSNEQLLTNWRKRARESQHAHYNSVKPLVRANYFLGVPVTILTSLVGTSLFATLEKTQTDPKFRLAIAMISVLAAVLAGLQTFLRFSERAEKHRSAGARYGALRRDIEVMQAAGAPFDPAQIETLKEKMNSLSTDAPEIPPRIWSKTEASLKERGQ